MLTVTVCLTVLPVLYFLNLGPLLWLDDNGYFAGLPWWADDIYLGAYAPLFWLGDSVPPFDRLLHWYLHLWLG